MTPDESPLATIARQVVARLDDIASKLDVIEAAELWLAAHELDRSIMLVDDEAPALSVLVDALRPLGVPIHAVTTSADDRAGAVLRAYGAAEVHVVASMGEVPAVWERTRSSVVVVDLHLGDGVLGLDVIRSLPDRGVRCVLVTSCTPVERVSVERVADRVHAEGIVRDGPHWEKRLREDVRTLMDAVTPEPFDA
jgi:CheY-like chemotaxis protein